MRISESRPDELVILDAVTKIYPSVPPIHAVRAFTLQIKRGQFVALMGASGSGKSTMLNILGLLDRPSSGSLVFESVDTSRLSDRERTKLRGQRIGFVFQAFHLVPYRSVVENVEMSLLYNGLPRSQRRPRAMEALDAVQLAERAHSIPTQLSGGQRQRVAIARALAVRPSMIICDEPTGNLDSATSQTILLLLDDLARRGTTIIVATHDHDVARHASRTLQMVDGRLVSQS